MKLAPIVLFTYNRPEHTKKTVDSLLNNTLASDSDLIIYSDGAKNSDDELYKKLRDYLPSITGFKSVTLKYSEKNLGLAQSVIMGVTEVLEKNESIIVMEDDLISSPHFLTYMNQALHKYKDSERVVSIHGYNYPIANKGNNAFFLKGADCWGWATWKRGWKLFNPNGEELLKRILSEGLSYEFDFFGSYPYTKMLQDQVNKSNNSWAIRWYASAFLENKLTLYPEQSLIINIGLDGSGTHCSSNKLMGNEVLNGKILFSDIAIEENIEMKKRIRDYFNSRSSIINRVLKKIFK